MELTFVPNAAGATDSPEVQFTGTGGVAAGRKLTIQVPARATSAGPFPVRQGTVAGTIRVELTSVTDGGTELLSNPPSVEIVIARQAPVITAMVLENERDGGFDVVISGYSTTREIGSVRLNFVAKPEARIDGATSASVDVSQLFAGYYARPASLANGSAFTGLRIPVNVGGSKAAIGAVEATLINTVGTSQPARVTR
jgi:hypothetical protein